MRFAEIRNWKHWRKKGWREKRSERVSLRRDRWIGSTRLENFFCVGSAFFKENYGKWNGNRGGGASQKWGIENSLTVLSLDQFPQYPWFPTIRQFSSYIFLFIYFIFVRKFNIFSLQWNIFFFLSLRINYLDFSPRVY